MLSSDHQALSLSYLEHLDTTSSQAPSLACDLQILTEYYVLGTELLALYWLYFLPSLPSLDSMVHHYHRCIGYIFNLPFAASSCTCHPLNSGAERRLPDFLALSF